MSDARRLSRRRFLGAGAAAGAASIVGAGVLGEQSAGAAPAQPTGEPAVLEPTPRSVAALPFHGDHQTGILPPPPEATAALALDVVAEGADGLRDLFRTLTELARSLTAGGPDTTPFQSGIASDNGILGDAAPAGGLRVTLGVGASLFDGRFGLADRTPSVLTPMRPFPNDNLDPAQTGGDLSLLLQAPKTDTVIHALRRINLATKGAVQPRWRIDGFVSPPRPAGTPRNLFGFRDGTANPDSNDAALMDELVWAGSGEPAWAAGGTYQVIRIIRQLVEFWDRVSVLEQENMIGRQRDTGAPLDGNKENDLPDYRTDPQGASIPLTAHIRVANPRTPATDGERILRRGVNYDRGLDVNGNLDQGLLFIAYNRNTDKQFNVVQTRLINEPMVDYISPIGGGYFFALPGVRDQTDWYGRSLLS